MAETIRGINVVIGADTTKLSKALSDVNQKSKDIQSELRQVDRLLKFDPGNTELLAQKQKLLSQAVANTSEKLDRLKSVQQQVNEQFQRGEISEGQYRAFQREIAKTQQELQRFQERLQETEQEQQKIASSTKQLETLFRATGTSVDQFADALGTKLTNAIKNGTASSKQLEEAIEKIGKAALGVNVDLEKFKSTLASVDDGNSLKNVQKELKNLSKEASDAGKAVSDLSIDIENVAGALVAGGGLAGAIEKSLDVSTLKTKIDVTFEVPESSKVAVKDAVRTIEAYGIDAEAALEGVRRQWALNKNASDETNTAIVKGAAAIATAYSGIDFTELIQEAHEVGAELNISNENALALISSLLKAGFPPEQLDIISEYGQQLQRAGYSAQEIQAIFKAGIDTGTWNIDNLLDGLKEGRIRLAEFGQGVPKATQELLKGTSISAKQLQEWGEAVAAGGEKGQKAMVEVAKALNGVKDETTKNALGVQIFGTMYEDQGQNIIDTLLNAKTTTVDFGKNQKQLNDLVSQMDASPAVQLQQAFADLKTASEPLLSVIADVVSSIAEWVSNNPTLAATIAAVGSVIGILSGTIMALTPIFTAISALLPVLGTAFAALTGPIGIAVAAIAGLVAAGVAIYKNWDTIKAKAIELWNKFGWLKNIALALIGPFGMIISAGISLYRNWDTIKAKAKELWNDLTKKWENIKSSIATKAQQIWQDVTQKWENIKSSIATKAQQIWQNVTQKWQDIKTNASNKIEELKNNAITKFQNIVNAARDKFNEIKNKIMSPIEKARNFVKDQVDKIKSFFDNLKLKLPKIKLPHFKLSGSFSLNPPRVPKISVDWYKVGGVFEKPVIFGNAGFGDVSEAIVPFEGRHARRIAGLIGKEMMREFQSLFAMAQPQSSGPIVIQIPIDGRVVAQANFRDVWDLISFDQNRRRRFK